MPEIETEILGILEQNPEEFEHANKTLEWLLIIKPDADFSLRIATLGHDIERAIQPWEMKDYRLDKGFRMQHARRSADIIREILEKHKVNNREIARVYNLILNHEFGGGEVDTLMSADSLANFYWCDYIFEKEKPENIRSVMERMYARLPQEYRKYLKGMKFKNPEIKQMLDDVSTSI